MGFWNRKDTAISPEERVRRIFLEAEGLSASKPKKALKLLDGLKGEAYPMVSFGGGYHHEFRRRALDALGWVGPLPDVGAFPWEHWSDYPTMADILSLASENAGPILYFFDPPTRLSRGPVVEIEGLHALAEDPLVLMLVIGEANTFLRRDLLLGLAGSLNPDSEEILQDLMNASRPSGLRVLNLVG